MQRLVKMKKADHQQRIFSVTGHPVVIITEFMHNGALSDYLVVSSTFSCQAQTKTQTLPDTNF